jgi:thiamine pyrophosphate-dependent acetolactate synthase large subunit-like protein
VTTTPATERRIGGHLVVETWPAALGAAAAHPDRKILAVCADGGLAYGLDCAETVAVDLVQPDLVRTAGAFGLPVRDGEIDTVEENLRWAIGLDGPAVIVVNARLASALPTP